MMLFASLLYIMRPPDHKTFILRKTIFYPKKTPITSGQGSSEGFETTDYDTTAEDTDYVASPYSVSPYDSGEITPVSPYGSGEITSVSPYGNEPVTAVTPSVSNFSYDQENVLHSVRSPTKVSISLIPDRAYY